MGTEAIWIPAAIGAASAGVGYYNNQRTLRKQNDATVAGLIRQRGLQDRANAQLGGELDQLARSNPAAERGSSVAQFMDTLRRARTVADGSTPQVLGANERYGQAVAGGRAGVDAEAANSAGDLAGILAPQLQRQGEGAQIVDLSGRLGEIGRQSAAQDFLTQLRVRSAQNNPWLTLLQGGLQGAASGYATRGAGDPNLKQWNKALTRAPGAPVLNDSIWQINTRGMA